MGVLEDQDLGLIAKWEVGRLDKVRGVGNDEQTGPGTKSRSTEVPTS